MVLPSMDDVPNNNDNTISNSNNRNTDIVSYMQQYDGIINRISDAAEPIMVKRCISFLTFLQISFQHIPIFNGLHAYTICCNKWLHHILFTQAKLYTPSSIILDAISFEKDINASVSTNAANNCIDTDIDDDNAHTTSNNDIPNTLDYNNIATICEHLLPYDTLPHIIKPNAGGFGNGIIKISSTTLNNNNNNNNDINNTNLLKSIMTSSNDQTIILQKYMETTTIYRVWFLLGKVQCAIQRRIQQVASSSSSSQLSTTGSETDGSGSSINIPTNEFTNGCSSRSSSCSVRHPTPSSSLLRNIVIQPWRISEEVRIEIEEQLLPLLGSDAHAGSVEFLIDQQQYSEDRRYYFDLNLLSTLPIDIEEQQETDEKLNHRVWDTNYNPWMELANGVLKVVNSKELK